MIVVTGGAGFIGSTIVWRLNTLNREDIVVVDALGNDEKWKNLVGLNFHDFVHKDDFVNYLDSSKMKIDAVIHMGANSSTTEKDADSLLRNNFEYTKRLAEYCLKNNVRFIYASSGATYGDGSLGFDDDESGLSRLRPLNMYGYSKSMFDLWALRRGVLNKIVGLKYFNVYGPNEYHKGDMRSVVNKAFEQVAQTGKVKLFKSANAKYKDGEQMRDFIYIKDAVEMTIFFDVINPVGKNKSGIFNVGSGEASTWNRLAYAVFQAMDLEPKIVYVDMPDNLRNQYQYFTQATINKIRNAGYKNEMTVFENAVSDYVKNYLAENKFLTS